jgi:hypothetical protein
MPFVSKSQLRTCYSKPSSSKWNCKEFLENTPNICCLPEKSSSSKSRCIKADERVVGKVQIGPRGGKYFEIREKSKGKLCTVKVYIPRQK